MGRRKRGARAGTGGQEKAKLWSGQGEALAMRVHEEQAGSMRADKDELEVIQWQKHERGACRGKKPKSNAEARVEKLV